MPLAGAYSRLPSISIGHPKLCEKRFIGGKTKGLGGLWEAQGRGRHRRWNQQDWQVLEQWVNEPRRYSAAQLSHKLSQERQVELGKEQVRRILKKKLQLETDSIESTGPEHQRSTSS